MNLQELINTAHTAQFDAGSQINFNQCFTAAKTALESIKEADPVASFLAAVLVANNGNVFEAAESLNFYVSELVRAARAIEKAASVSDPLAYNL